MRHWLPLLLGCFLVLVLPATKAQGDPNDLRRPASNPVEPPEQPKKPRWPRLSSAQKSLAELQLKRLAHKDPERSQAAAETLKALGPGVAPLVLGRLSDAQPQLNEVLETIASAVTRREHSPLLTPYLQHHLKTPRIVAARLLGRTQAREACPELRAALAPEKDPEIREVLALTLCRLGDPAGLPSLHELALQAFLDRREEILQATAPLKGPAATTWLLDRLATGNLSEKIAALRLLSLAGTRQAVQPIVPFLEHDSHVLKTEAINALRTIVYGHPPLKHISVFDMIRMRQELQTRLQGLQKED